MKTIIFFILNLILVSESKPLNEFISDVLSEITKENHLNLETKCFNQMKIWLKSIESNQTWALNVIDSFGRRPSGFLAGNVVWPGEYSQCLDIKVTEWTSKYCYVNQKIKWINTLNRNDTLRFKYGMCFPNTCTDSDLTKIFQYALKNLDANELPFDKSQLKDSEVYCREKPKIDTFLIIAIIFTATVGFLVLSATILEVYFKLNKSENPKVQSTESTVAENEIKIDENLKPKSRIISEENLTIKILLCFSAYKNTLRIFQTDEKSKSQFLCLNSIRFWAFMWVVVLHQWNHYTEIDDIVLSNKFEYVDWKKNFLFTIVSNGYFCVDVFFLISGFLCAYNFLKQSNAKKITWRTIVKFYIRRYYRITVTLILVMFFIVGFNRFFHPGPFRSEFYYASEKQCPTYFWTNLLHINNFYLNSQCFPHSWYLATDMQFYLISPLVLIPLSFKNKIRFVGFALIGIIIMIHVITTAVFVSNQNKEVSFFKYQDIMGIYYRLEFFPWCRVAPFAFGLLLGKIIIDLPKKKLSFIKNKTKNSVVIILAWIISLLFLAIVIFGQYSTFSGLDAMNRTSQVLYVTLCRLVFSIGLSGVIFLCITQNGGFLDQFMSWSLWAPLAKLSFCAYLVHYSIVDSYIYSQEHFVYMQPSLFFYVYCGNLFLTICLAYVANLLFESPFMNLEKYLFSK